MEKNVLLELCCKIYNLSRDNKTAIFILALLNGKAVDFYWLGYGTHIFFYAAGCSGIIKGMAEAVNNLVSLEK